MAGHRQVAEDVASETCLRAWKKFRDRVPWADLWAWSVRVARNLLVNHWRAEKRERIETGRSTELLPFGATELEAGDGWKARVHILVVCPCPN
jgi:DNA-directed RNA polymerase specialized sigma24 family protein